MSLAKIKGHSQIVRRFQEVIQENRLGGVYLFSGPEGIGKSLLAKELAKALNCQEEGRDGCDLCPSCLKIEKMQHPDVHFINSGDSEIKIEFIRQLQRDINLRAYEGRKKVFIINDAHKLNENSSNAILKTLEESGAGNLIILVTAKPELLFKTVISRCQGIKFSAFHKIDLEQILKQEYGLDQLKAHFLACFCEGKLGQALALKDSDIIKDKNQTIDAFCLKTKENLPEEAGQKRNDIRWQMHILITWFRDIYLAKVGVPLQELMHFDRKESLENSINNFSFPEIDQALQGISSSLLQLEQNINTRLLLVNLKLSIRRL